MATKYLRQDIKRRFWLMFEELEDYDPFVMMQCYIHRRTGAVIEIGTTGGNWRTDDIESNQYVSISRSNHTSHDRAMIKAYINMARYHRVLVFAHGTYS